jgi:hypothetical protein
MLLSMFTSFLLARRFKGKVYVLLMTVVLILMSLLSIGFPSVWGTLSSVNIILDGTTVWQVNLPAIPLSFPFHASISEPPPINIAGDWMPPIPFPPLYSVKLYFLAYQVWTNEMLGPLHLLTSEHIVLLLPFFLLVNLVGAILGYWISKATFIETLFARRKTKVSPA